MKTLLGKLFWGVALAFGGTLSAHAFIIDDFNTTNRYSVEDTTTGDGGNSLVTGIDAGNVVWGVDGGAAGATRTITADLQTGERVETAICEVCQTGELIADAGLVPSEGNYVFEWTGPSANVEDTVFAFIWQSDLSGSTWEVEFEDDVGDIASSGVQGGLDGGLVVRNISIPLPAFPGTVPGGAGYGDVTRVRLSFDGVPALDANFDFVQFQQVPEPELLALFGLGLLGLGWQTRRRRPV